MKHLLKIWQICLVTACIYNLVSCSLFKRSYSTKEASESVVRNNQTIQQDEQSDYTKQLEKVVQQKDSSQSDYQLRLWPKGKLTFSAANGFEGEFDSVFISGRSDRRAQRTSSANYSSSARHDRSLNFKADSTVKEVLKKADKRSTPDYIWIMVVLGILLIAAFIFRKKLLLKH
jgi:hypothetical protein